MHIRQKTPFVCVAHLEFLLRITLTTCGNVVLHCQLQLVFFTNVATILKPKTATLKWIYSQSKDSHTQMNLILNFARLCPSQCKSQSLCAAGHRTTKPAVLSTLLLFQAVLSSCWFLPPIPNSSCCPGFLSKLHVSIFFPPKLILSTKAQLILLNYFSAHVNPWFKNLQCLVMA